MSQTSKRAVLGQHIDSPKSIWGKQALDSLYGRRFRCSYATRHRLEKSIYDVGTISTMVRPR